MNLINLDIDDTHKGVGKAMVLFRIWDTRVGAMPSITAMIILEYRLHHCLTNFDRSVFVNLKPILIFLAFILLGFYLDTIGVN